MNRVNYLLDIPFHSLLLKDELEVKRLGPYQPLVYSYSVASGKQKQNLNVLWFKTLCRIDLSGGIISG